MAVDWANAFFSIPIRKEDQKEFIFTQNGYQQTFRVLPQFCVHSSVLCPETVPRELETLDIPHTVTSTHDIDDTMLLRQDEKKAGHM